MKKIITKSVLAAVILYGGLHSNAQGVLSFSSRMLGGSGGGLDQVIGWEFVPSVDIILTRLGMYDGYANGGFRESHFVGVWDTNTNLLANTVLDSGDSLLLEGSFRFAEISPLPLLAGNTYIIASSMPNPVSDYTWNVDNPSVFGMTIDSRIQIVASRNILSAGSLAFPINRMEVGIVPVGPNFVIAVPEPSIVGFICLSGLGALWLGRKNRH